MDPKLVEEEPTLAALRRWLLALVAAGALGIATDLLLLGHVEDAAQWVPLVGCGLALTAVAVHAVTGRAAGTLRAAMLVLIAMGLTGIVLHYRGNMEFQLELSPDLSGFALFSEVMQAKAPPALAPSSMVMLGLMGLGAVHRLAPPAPLTRHDERS